MAIGKESIAQAVKLLQYSAKLSPNFLGLHVRKALSAASSFGSSSLVAVISARTLATLRLPYWAKYSPNPKASCH